MRDSSTGTRSIAGLQADPKGGQRSRCLLAAHPERRVTISHQLMQSKLDDNLVPYGGTIQRLSQSVSLGTL
jgi:hypothetical protein